MPRVSPYAIAIFFVCIVLAASQDDGLDPPAEVEDAMNSCCKQGREFGANKRAATCNLKDKSLQPVPAGDLPDPDFPHSNYSRARSTCEIFFEACCQQRMTLSAKEEGRQIARRGDSCLEATQDFGEAFKKKAISSCTACYSGNNNTFSEDNCNHKQSVTINEPYNEIMDIASNCKKQGKQFGRNKRTAHVFWPIDIQKKYLRVTCRMWTLLPRTIHEQERFVKYFLKHGVWTG